MVSVLSFVQHRAAVQGFCRAKAVANAVHSIFAVPDYSLYFASTQPGGLTSSPESNDQRVRGARIAFLEDDASFAAPVRDWLIGADYVIDHFLSGRDCLSAMLSSKSYALGLFDWQLPDISGPQVMAQLHARGQATPVIFLTCQASEQKVAEVLLAGADDYVIKPPVYAVLDARMQSLLRRSMRMFQGAPPESLGRLTIDCAHRTFLRDGQPVALTPRETDLAVYLFMHRGELVPRARLNQVLNVDPRAVDTRRLDVHMSHLRSKLGLTADQGFRLSSVYRQGYRLEYIGGW